MRSGQSWATRLFLKSRLFPSYSSSFLRRQLLLENVLEGDGIGGKLADTLAQLLDGHLVLVEVESEEGLVVDVALLLEVQGGGAGGVQLLGDGLGGVEKILEQVGLRRSRMLVMKGSKVELIGECLRRWSGSRSQRAQ